MWRSKVAAAAMLFAFGNAAQAQNVTVKVGTGDPNSGVGLLMSEWSGSTQYQHTYSATSFSTPFYIESVSFFADAAGTLLARGSYDFFFATVLNGVVSPQQEFRNLTIAGGTLSSGQAYTVFGGPFFYNPSQGDLYMNVLMNQLPQTPTEKFLQSGFQYDFDGTNTTLVTRFAGEVTVTPEPATLALTLTGTLFLVGVVVRRSRRARRA